MIFIDEYKNIQQSYKIRNTHEVSDKDKVSPEITGKKDLLSRKYEIKKKPMKIFVVFRFRVFMIAFIVSIVEFCVYHNKIDPSFSNRIKITRIYYDAN